MAKWAHISVEVLGSSHERANAPCQDATESLALADGKSVALMVSDGSGQARHSQHAARLVINAALDVLQKTEVRAANSTEFEADVRNAFLATRQSFDFRLSTVIAELGGEPRDYRCTFALAVLAPPWVGFCGVGDAFLILGDGEDDVHLVVAPDRRGDAENEVAFLSRDSEPLCTTICAPHLSGAVLSTDGMEKFLDSQIVQYAEGPRRVITAPRHETFAPMIREVRNGMTAEKLSAVLTADSFRHRKGDDIGLAVAALK